MRTFISGLAITMLLCCGPAARGNELKPVVPTQTIELFNGTDLSGWYPYLKGHAKGEDPEGVITVKDGLLHIAVDARGYRGARDVEKPAGEWNRFEVVAKDDTLTLLLNGVAVNAVYDIKPQAGQIQIQIEGGDTWFRRIALEPLAGE